MTRKIKICGMKYRDNIEELLRLNPDYIGFIFYKKSSRYISSIPSDIDFGDTSKVGVFVDEEINIVKDIVDKNRLDYVQLHGDEPIAYCTSLKEKGIKIIKAFAIDKNFDFKSCYKYEEIVDIFLFDAKGELPGGNGISYDWSVLNEYHGKISFLLSGGIQPNDIDRINRFTHDKLLGIDINSGFEMESGLKNIKNIQDFKSKLR